MLPDESAFRLDLAPADVDPLAAERIRRAGRATLAVAVTPGALAGAARAVRHAEPVVAGVAAALYTAWALGRAVLG
jgi:hypothetical protein